MYGELHILTGIAFQKAGPLEWAIPASILSHFSLDAMNWRLGENLLYHKVGMGRVKWALLAARIVIGLLLLVYLCLNPQYLVCGLISWLCFDWEWIISPLFKRHGFGLHENMFPKWLSSQWGILVILCSIIVMLGLVTQ